MARINKHAWTILPLIGAASGILSMTMSGPLGLALGGVFGIFITTYFVLFEGLRSIAKAAFLVIAFLIAYACAFYGSLFVTQLPPWLVYGYGSDNANISIVCAGGLIGGLLVAASVAAVFRSGWSNLGVVVVIALLGSLSSGFLGVVAWVLGPSLGKALWSLLPNSALPTPDSYNLYSLYFVWQTSMALFLGFAAHVEEKRIPAPNVERLKALALHSRLPPTGQTAKRKAYLIAAVVLFGLVLARVVAIRVSLAGRQEAAARKLAETPSKQGLPRIQPMTIDEALILGDIAGLHPVEPRCTGQPESNEKGYLLPPSMYYGVTYLPASESSFTGPGSVTVSVQQYPNSQWASYLAQYPHNIVNLFDDPKNPATITKFQSKVRSNTLEIGPGVPLYFIWSSGNDVVMISYYTPNNNDEEFLRRYLEKYPSSLD